MTLRKQLLEIHLRLSVRVLRPAAFEPWLAMMEVIPPPGCTLLVVLWVYQQGWTSPPPPRCLLTDGSMGTSQVALFPVLAF